MSPRLDGHVALVTGAARGIGQAFAERLANDGARVALVDREPATETMRLIDDSEGHAQVYQVDITKPDQIEEFATRVEAELGTVDILVNNAGVYPRIPFAELGLDQWRSVFAVNVEAVFMLTQRFLPAMRDRGWGRVINTGSNAVALQVPGMAHYMASKMAVVGLTRGVATEAGPDGVTANVIAPSSVRTPGTADIPEEAFDQLAQMQSIRRVETPLDLVGAMAFLASDDAAFITGQTIYVDGGMVRSS